MMCKAILISAMTLCNAFTMICCFTSVFDSKRKHVFAVCLISLSMLLFQVVLAQFSLQPLVEFILVIIGCFLLFCLITKDSIPGKLYLFFSQISIMNFIFLIAGVVAELLAEYGSVRYYSLMTALVLLLDVVFAFVVWKYGKRFCALLFASTKGRIWFVYAGLVMIWFILLKGFCFDASIIVFPYPLLQRPVLAALSLACLVGFILLPVSMLNAYAAATSKYDLQLARSSLSSGREYYKKLADFSEKLRILKHDDKHHMMVLQKLVAAGDLENAGAYLNTLDLRYEDTQLQSYCNSPVVNALLVGFYERCEARGVRFTANVKLCDGLDDYELCIVLGNLLENAFEATTKLPEHERSIALTMKPNGSQFGIRVENSFGGEVITDEGVPVSRKPDGGMGIRSIKSIIAQQNGTYDANWDERSFRAYVVLFHEG